MRIAIVATMFAASVCLALPVFADSELKANDIIRIFAAAKSHGTERGVCVGTQDECETRAKAEVPTGTDMFINFALNSADLSPEAHAKLSEFVKALTDSRLMQSKFVVEGYTDASGSETYNKLLSLRRARSVATFLIGNGVQSSRLQAIGRGENSPRVTDPYDPVNRRVEMHIKE